MNITYIVKRPKLLNDFQCLQDHCPDTCCKEWNMQVEDEIIEKYRNIPYLEEATEPASIKDYNAIMRKDPNTGYCLQLCDKKCSIHKDFGEELLGDACYFYPKVTRQFGTEIRQTFTLSCPEITRLVFTHQDPFALVEIKVPRLPHILRDYNKKALHAESQVKIIQKIQEDIFESDLSVEELLCHLLKISLLLDNVPQDKWEENYKLWSIKNSERDLSTKKNDPHLVLYGFGILALSQSKAPAENLINLLHEIERKLGVELVKDPLRLEKRGDSFYEEAQHIWNNSTIKNSFLKKWLLAQLSFMHFPFAGLGDSCFDKIVLLCHKFLFLRLALICCLEDQRLDISSPSENIISPHLSKAMEITYILSRFYDHLEDPTLSLLIYKEFNCYNIEDLIGILQDH